MCLDYESNRHRKQLTCSCIQMSFTVLICALTQICTYNNKKHYFALTSNVRYAHCDLFIFVFVCLSICYPNFMLSPGCWVLFWFKRNDCSSHVVRHIYGMTIFKLAFHSCALLYTVQPFWSYVCDDIMFESRSSSKLSFYHSSASHRHT